ncbi:8-oxoguanine deaminase [bacterium]|nr:8-oxoguanine deaminase [bacterium]
MLILRNCMLVATFDEKGSEIANADILIDGNIISKIGKDISFDTELTDVIDCTGCVAIPGLVNCHHHFYQTLTRNLPGAQDAKLFDWLKYLYPIWAKLDADAVFNSTLLACAELLKTGCTLSSDHMYLYPREFKGDIMELQFEAADRLGIRFSPTRGSMTLGEADGGLPPDNVVQSTEDVVCDMERVIDRFHDSSPLSMHKIALAPCSPFSVDPSLMIETASLARDRSVILHTHLGETMDEEDFCLEKYGKRPLELMEKWNWLGEDVYFAHGIYFNDMELELLAETGTGVCHCPTSNMRLGSGIARIREMLDTGIRLGLGVDGSASNDSSDMLGEVRNAMLLQRVKYGSSSLSAREVLSMASHGGAKLLGYSNLGSLQAGMGADIAVFNLDSIGYAGGLSDPLAALVFSGFDHTAKYTVVDGQVVVKNGKIANIDEKEIISRANESAKRLFKRNN